MATTLHVHRHLLRSRATAGTATVPAAEIQALFADVLRSVEPSGPDGVWLIRRLDVQAPVRAEAASGAGSRAAAQALADALLRALNAALALGPDGSEVRWFPDRAAFLAQWLADLCHGRTTDRWEYRPFRATSASTAVLERAEAEPEQIRFALRRLSAAERDELVALLAPSDAAAIAHATVRGGGSMAHHVIASAVRRLLDAVRLPNEPRRATLLTLVELEAIPTATDAACARDLALVALALRDCTWIHRDALARALARGDWTAAAGLGTVDAAVAFGGWSAADRAAALRMLTRAAPTAAASVPSERMYTRHGGLFLLVPLLAELPFGDAVLGWPALDRTPPVDVLSALAVLAVLGTDAVLADPWYRLALGVPEWTVADLARWTNDVSNDQLGQLPAALEHVLRRRAAAVDADLGDPELLIAGLRERTADAIRVAACALLRELSFRLPGMATASAGHLRRNVLALDAYVSIEPARIIVELGRPPLDLLLSITGMNRRSFTLATTGERSWVLTTRR